MNILLTFTGFHDPYTLGLIGGEEVPGPILSLLSVRTFDQVILFDTPNTRENTQLTKMALEKRYPDLSVAVRDLPLNDPTDYLEILTFLRRHSQEIVTAQTMARYFISVASGTPQMHACWLLLAAGGELPATLLHIRPPKFVTADRPLLEEVDLTRPGFPVVRSFCAVPEIPDLPPPDLETAIRQSGIVGDHPSILRALETCALLAPSDAPVLILGETGTGKELFARFIHRLSLRPADRFVPVNCGAIPAELVESLLFGHVKGAFTGAQRDQAGKFTQADGGTLFLDELGELPLAAQVKLLAGAPGRYGGAPGGLGGPTGRCAPHRRHQPGPAPGRPGGKVPGRPLLSLERRRNPVAAPPGKTQRHPQAGPLRSGPPQRQAETPQAPDPGGPVQAARSMPGPGTSGTWKTPWSAPPASPPKTSWTRTTSS